MPYHSDQTTIIAVYSNAMCSYSYTARSVSMVCPLYPYHKTCRHQMCTVIGVYGPLGTSYYELTRYTLCRIAFRHIGYPCCHRNVLVGSEIIHSYPYGAEIFNQAKALPQMQPSLAIMKYYFLKYIYLSLATTVYHSVGTNLYRGHISNKSGTNKVVLNKKCHIDWQQHRAKVLHLPTSI